jgi:hypothetical protein
LDAADTSSILADSSSNVSLWIDKSNTGTIATPTRGASANPITYVTIDGYRGVYINNNGSILYNASTYSQLTVQSNFQTTADYSIFAVVNLSNITSGSMQTIYGNERGTSGEKRGPNFGAGQSFEFNADGSSRVVDLSFIGTGRLQTALISSSSALTAYTNATAYGSATNAYTGPSTDAGPLPRIGGSFGSTNDPRFATGYFHEILFYNSVLTTVQRQKVEGYLAQKWGLQTSLPANHPHKTAGPTYEEPVFVPTLISRNQIWFDAFDASYAVSGTTVTGWTNKTGNSNASTGGGTVRINQSTLNGKSSVRFAAGTNFLTVGAQSYTTSYRNLFFVVTVGASGSHYTYLNCDDVICGQCYSWDDGDIELNKAGTLGIRTSTPTNFFSSTSVVSICTSSGGNTGIFVNGISQTITNNNVGTGGFWSTGTTSVTITLGGRSGFTGGTTDMYELLQYDGSLTPSQRQRVEGYLAQKWGIHSSLPANHPYKTTAPTGIPRYITIQELSALFSDVNIQSLSIASNAALSVGTNNHTIEFWFYQTSRDQYDTIFTYGSSPPEWTSRSNYFINMGTNQFTALIGDGSGGFLSVNGGSLVTLNTWHHLALVRNGTTFTLYINGTSRSTLTSSMSIGPQIGSMTIGTWGLNGADRFRGYVSNFRFVNGTAVYTSNFTPPTSPLTAIPNTQLLLQGLVDRSPNAFTVTSTGSVTVSTLSPFV